MQVYACYCVRTETVLVRSCSCEQRNKTSSMEVSSYKQETIFVASTMRKLQLVMLSWFEGHSGTRKI